MPAVGCEVMEPFALPHVDGVGVNASCGPAMSVMVALAVVVHPFASVIVMVYAPAATFVKFWVVAVLLHTYVNGLVPLVIVVATDPFDCPHVDDVGAAVAVGPGMFITVVLAVTVQPLASVTVTV